MKITPTLLRRKKSRFQPDDREVGLSSPNDREGLGADVDQADLVGPSSAGQPSPANDGNDELVLQTDTPAKEYDRRIGRRKSTSSSFDSETEDALPFQEEVALFREKNKSKRVRLTCCSSTSTSAKSVLYVKSKVKLRVRPYLKSTPQSPSISSLTVGNASRSVVTSPRAYGLSSMFCELCGVSNPTSVAADDILITPRFPHERGIGVMWGHLVFRADNAPDVDSPYLRSTSLVTE